MFTASIIIVYNLEPINGIAQDKNGTLFTFLLLLRLFLDWSVIVLLDLRWVPSPQCYLPNKICRNVEKEPRRKDSPFYMNHKIAHLNLITSGIPWTSIRSISISTISELHSYICRIIYPETDIILIIVIIWHVYPSPHPPPLGSHLSVARHPITDTGYGKCPARSTLVIHIRGGR